MLEAAKDSVAVAKSSEAAMDSYGKEAVQEYTEIPAIQLLNVRGEFSATMGVLPPWARPLVQILPCFGAGRKAHENLAGMAVVMVAKRLSTAMDRNDLLSKLQQGTNSEGKPMGKEELTGEAVTQLVAGSDTTSKCVHYISQLIWSSGDKLHTEQFFLCDNLLPRALPPRSEETSGGTRRVPG